MGLLLLLLLVYYRVLVVGPIGLCIFCDHVLVFCFFLSFRGENGQVPSTYWLFLYLWACLILATFFR